MTKRKTAIPKRTRPAKLNQREKEGVRLIAELIVFREIQNKVIPSTNLDEHHVEGLKKVMEQAVPELLNAEKYLQQKILEGRKGWAEFFRERIQ